MYNFCIYIENFGGSLYNPPDSKCSLGYDDEEECGEYCSYFCSPEDSYDNLIDYEYDRIRDSF